MGALNQSGGYRMPLRMIDSTVVRAHHQAAGAKGGLLASSARKTNITKIRALLGTQRTEETTEPELEPETTSLALREPCPCCGGTMRVIEVFRRGQIPMSRAPPQEQAA